MVIPIPAGLAPPLAGPPPPELAGKFQIIKMCTITLVACAIGRIVAGFLIQAEAHQGTHRMSGGSSHIGSAVSLFVNALIGIFLQNDDPTFRPIYSFMTSTCCQPCHEQGMCQGGLSCLMPFAVFNAVSVICDLLLPPALWQLLPIYGNKALAGDLGSGFLTVSLVAAVLAEAIAAYYGWRCIQLARDGGVTMQGGDWGQEMQNRPAGGGFGGGGPLGGGGPGQGLMGRFGGGNYAYDRQNDEEDGQPSRTQVSGNFAVFQGQGQRLGGE